MFLLGNPLWTVTGAGTPAPEPEPEAPVEQPRGRAAWLAELPRTEADIRRDRQRFGVIPPEAEEAIAEVALRQAMRDERDEQKRFDELYRELELRRIEFDARYLEAMNAMRERAVEAARAIRGRRQEEDDLLVLLLLAAAAAEVR